MTVIPERINILPKQASSIRNLLMKDDTCTSTPYGFRDDCGKKNTFKFYEFIKFDISFYISKQSYVILYLVWIMYI